MSAARPQRLNIELAALDSSVLRSPEGPPMRFVESYSGVRGTFGGTRMISAEASVITLVYAHAYVTDLLGRWAASGEPRQRLRLVVGRDPRPTSETLMDLQCLGMWLACDDAGVDLQLFDAGIVTTPGIQAVVRAHDTHGGVMVTGSHNPVGDNGLKYLTGTAEPDTPSSNEGGTVLNGAKMGAVIASARERLAAIAAGDEIFLDRALQCEFPAAESVAVAPIYGAFVRSVFGLDETRLHAITTRSREQGRAVVVDANGGAGAELIPETLGAFARVVAINTTPGNFAHAIEPVGSALDEAAAAVVRAGADVGVVVDADADRGNLVVRDSAGVARQLHPQDVALLNTVGILAWVRAYPQFYPDAAGRELAVVAHGATSGRVAAAARELGARYHEVETGEVNVVAKMHELTAAGAFVPIGVEGSNGGTVFHGSRVRDGALTALMSLLAVTDEAVVEQLRGTYELPPRDLLLADLLDALPEWHTIQSVIRVDKAAVSQRLLKDAFEARALAAFDAQVDSGAFAEVGTTFDRLEILHHEETRTLLGAGNRHSHTGGFKLRLTAADSAAHFVWFRVSKTESGVARIVADSPDATIARRLHELASSWYRDLAGTGD